MVYIHNEISSIQKTYDLYRMIHEYTKTFPKADKYSLGEKIKNVILDILELLMEAESAKRDWKEWRNLYGYAPQIDPSTSLGMTGARSGW